MAKEIKFEADARSALAAGVNKLADAVYDMIIEIAEGKDVSGINGKFNNNTIDVPSKLLDPQSITKDNLSDLVKAEYITQERFDELTK